MKTTLNLSEYFNERLRRGLPLNVEWHCRRCDEWHGIDLLRSVASFETRAVIETNAGDFTADYLFYNAKNLPIFTILLIDDAAAAERIESFKAAAYYGRLQNIPLVLLRTNAVTDPDADAVDPADILVDYCLVPRCGVCHQHKIPARLQIMKVKCLGCGQNTTFPILNDSWGIGAAMIDDDSLNSVAPIIRPHTRRNRWIECGSGKIRGTLCEHCAAPVGFYDPQHQLHYGDTICKVEILGIEFVPLINYCYLCTNLSPVGDAEQFAEEVENLNRDMTEIEEFIAGSRNSEN